MAYIRQTHQWDVMEVLLARCPRCKKDVEIYCGIFMEGDIVHCPECHKDFKLGKQK